MPARIVFFGNERLATGVSTHIPVLKALIDAHYDITSVVTSGSSSHSRNNRELEIIQYAASSNIPVISSDISMTDLLTKLDSLKADIGVLVAYGKLIPKQLIDLFPRGIINLHPSLLPHHRGPIPLESVILDGSTATGVSLMQLAVTMDSGPVWAQESVSLNPVESKQELADRIGILGAKLIIDQLPRILEGVDLPTKQNDQSATYDKRIQKSDGVLDFNKPAVVLTNEVRAYLGWPGSKTTIYDRDVTVTMSHAEVFKLAVGQLQVIDSKLMIGTSKDAFVIDRLKPAGKNEMTAQAFIAGSPQLR